MLDNFQRITVETVRNHRGRVSIVLDNEERTNIATAFADDRFNKDIAIALQGYFNRHKNYETKSMDSNSNTARR